MFISFMCNIWCAYILQVSSFQLLFAGPKTGIPSPTSLSLDPSIIDEIIQAWQSKITTVVKSLKIVQKRKHFRDQSLLLGLLTCGSENAMKIKVSGV